MVWKKREITTKYKHWVAGGKKVKRWSPVQCTEKEPNKRRTTNNDNKKNEFQNSKQRRKKKKKLKRIQHFTRTIQQTSSHIPKFTKSLCFSFGFWFFFFQMKWNPNAAMYQENVLASFGCSPVVPCVHSMVQHKHILKCKMPTVANVSFCFNVPFFFLQSFRFFFSLENMFSQYCARLSLPWTKKNA